MKVLVTGATGFVGEKLAHYLVDQGLDVHILVRSMNKTKNFSPKIKKIEGDVTNPEHISKATKDADGVFHLAGLVGYSKEQRAEMEQINVKGTRYVVDAVKQNKVKRLLHFSSVVAIGSSFDKTPLNENSPYNISHLHMGYSETKKAAEDLVMAEVKNGSIDAVAVNPSTIYGYGDATKGSRKVQIKVAQGKFPFNVPGGVSIIAVEDVCEATFNAFKNGRSGERYILSGENLLLKDVFEIIAKEAGVEPPKLFLNKTALLALGFVGDTLEKFGLRGPLSTENAWNSILYHWYDNSKAKRELQLNPRPAKMAIHNSVQWMKDTGLLSK